LFENQIRIAVLDYMVHLQWSFTGPKYTYS